VHYIIPKISQIVPPTLHPRSRGQNNKAQPLKTGNFSTITTTTIITGITGTLAAIEEISVVIAAITLEIIMDICVRPML
jgi:hypothetical protein